MKAFAMRLFCALLRVCYFFIKCCTRPRHKAVFISRQSDRPGLDFTMLAEELRRQDPTLEVVTLCRTMGKGLWRKAGYGLHMLRQMGHLATARIAVLDGYCIAASVLRHKKELNIYQLWHALGLLKNFGYAAIGTAEGSAPATARIMRMHRGYRRIVCSAPGLIPALAACYDAPQDRFLPVGLPRVDFLTDPDAMAACRQELLAAYPVLADGKPVVLYVPTFRKSAVPLQPLDRALDLHRYHLVIKQHDGAETVLTDTGVYRVASGKTGMEWLAAADFVVTDYSAVLFEAFTARRKVILYCPDWEEYSRDRGFAVDYAAIPAPHCATPRGVANALEGDWYDPAVAEAFCEQNVACRGRRVTATLAGVLLADEAGRPFDLADPAWQK